MTTPADSSPSPIRVHTREEGSIVRSLEVEVDSSLVKRAFERSYRDLAKQVRVRGFRPGKAPRSVLEKLYGASVTEQVEHALVAQTLPDAVEQSGLRPVTEPDIDASPLRDDTAFQYTARVEVRPEVVLPETRGLSGRRRKVEVQDADVDRELEALRLRNAPLLEEPDGCAVTRGHVLRIDFVGRIDGRPFGGGSGRGVELEVGSGRFMPGFEEQLIGARAGEDREVRIQFPDDDANPEVAGKEGIFSVHVADIKRRHLPDLDDEFAKDLGDFATLDDLRQRIRSDLMTALLSEADAGLRRSLMDTLIELTAFEVPPGLVAQELERQLGTARRRLADSMPEATLRMQLERWKEEWRERAERVVRERLLLEAVAQAEELAVDDDEVAARIEQVALGQGTDAATLRRTVGEEDLQRAMRDQLIDERALDFLVAEAKIEETTDS